MIHSTPRYLLALFYALDINMAKAVRVGLGAEGAAWYGSIELEKIDLGARLCCAAYSTVRTSTKEHGPGTEWSEG